MSRFYCWGRKSTCRKWLPQLILMCVSKFKSKQNNTRTLTLPKIKQIIMATIEHKREIQIYRLLSYGNTQHLSTSQLSWLCCLHWLNELNVTNAKKRKRRRRVCSKQINISLLSSLSGRLKAWNFNFLYTYLPTYLLINILSWNKIIFMKCFYKK